MHEPRLPKPINTTQDVTGGDININSMAITAANRTLHRTQLLYSDTISLHILVFVLKHYFTVGINFMLVIMLQYVLVLYSVITLYIGSYGSNSKSILTAC